MANTQRPTNRERNRTATKSPKHDPRRTAMLVIGLVMLAAGAWMEWFAPQAADSLTSSSLGRCGLVLIALWIAYPSLRKPAQWLPPGAVILGVVGVGIIALQPRLLLVIGPLFGGLLALAGFVRWFRTHSS